MSSVMNEGLFKIECFNRCGGAHKLINWTGLSVKHVVEQFELQAGKDYELVGVKRII